MAKWDYKKMEELLNQFSRDGDPKDPRERKRLRIVDAATHLFIERSYRKTSVEDVAERAGVAKGTVYLYFKNKAELMLHAIVEEKKRYLSTLKSVLDPGLSPRERLRQWIRTAFIVANEMPLISKLISGDREILMVMDELSTAIDYDWQTMQIDFMSDLIDAAAAPHRWNEMEIRDRARVLMGLVHHFSGLIADERVRRGLSIERFSTIMADMIIDGIGVTKTGDVTSNHSGGKK